MMKKLTIIRASLKAAVELFPSLTSIFLGELLLVYLFLNAVTERLSFEFFGYAILEAVSLFCVGKLSDKWSRKKVLVLVHFLTLPILIVFYFYIFKDQIEPKHLETQTYLLLAAGLLYNPGPPSRAIIIDNYKSTIAMKTNNNFYSTLGLNETRLIGISWIIQYLPWALAPFFSIVTKSNYLLILIVLMGLNIPLLFLRLIDNLEKSLHVHHETITKSFNKSPLTFLALLLAQVVFWATFDKLDFFNDRQFIFSMVGVGATIGTVFSLFHKKTPHVSAITNYYEFGIMLSLVSLIFSYYISDSILFKFQLVMISAIGGFYLPFVYDIVVSKSGMQHRGTMFACAEVMQGIASVFGLLLITASGSSAAILFSITTVLFIGAHQLQSREKEVTL